MGESRITTRAFYKKIAIFPDFRHAMSLRISSTFDSRAFQGVLDAYKNGAKFHRLVRNSTVQSTEKVKIFSRKLFALEVGLGREEVQGIIIIQGINTSVKKYASERGFSSSSSEEEVRFFLSSVLQNFRRAAARVHLTRVASHARTSKLWFKEQETDQVRGAQPTSSG